MTKRRKKKSQVKKKFPLSDILARLFVGAALVSFLLAIGIKVIYYYAAKKFYNDFSLKSKASEQENKPNLKSVEKIVVWDYAFVSKINPDNGLPLGRANVFNINKTKYIYSWLRITNSQFFIKDQHLVRWEWYDPSGLLIKEYSVKTRPPLETGIDHFIYYWISDMLNFNELKSEGRDEKSFIGVWKVKVYIDEEFAYMDDFQIVNEEKSLEMSRGDFRITNFVGEGKIFRSEAGEIREFPLKNLLPVKEKDEILVYEGYKTSLLEEQSFPNSLFITNNEGITFRAFAIAEDLPKQDSRFNIILIKNNKEAVIQLSSGGLVLLEGTLEVINAETNDKIILSSSGSINDSLPAVRIDSYSKKFIKWDFILRPTVK